MQTIRQVVWDRMKEILQVGESAPNFLVEAKNDDGIWIKIPTDAIGRIDIDNRLDFDASTFDFTVNNEDGTFTPDRIGHDGLWRTIFYDDFTTDKKTAYSRYSNFKWKKDTISNEDDVTKIKSVNFNGYTQSSGSISILEFDINIKDKARVKFEYRNGNGKGGSNATPIPDDDATQKEVFYDDFKTLNPIYRYLQNGKCEKWIIRDYKGLKVMSSGFCNEKFAQPDLILPIVLPFDCILEYRHRLMIPRPVPKAYLKHRLYDNNKNTRPEVPPAPVNLPPYTQIDPESGGIEFLGNHGGHIGDWEHHQHILRKGTHDLIFTTWYEGKHENSHWELDYIKIFPYSKVLPQDVIDSEKGNGVPKIKLVVDGVVIRAIDVTNITNDNWHKYMNGWVDVVGSGKHKIRIEVDNLSSFKSTSVDIDNIMVQEWLGGDATDSKGSEYAYLLWTNTPVRVSLGYGNSEEDLIQRFIGLIDKVVTKANGTMEISCRDNMKFVNDTSIRPVLGKHSIAYPEYGYNNWWVASDVIADLINRAGCIALVERTTIVDEKGAVKPYYLPAVKFQEGRMIIDCMREVSDGINYRCWANRQGHICLSAFRYKGQADPVDRTLTEYVDLTDLEYTIDDADARGLLRVVCTYNNQAEIYMDEFLHHVVCKGNERYASIESEWMQTPAQRKIMAEYVFRQMKRKFRTISIGTQGNPFADVMDFVETLETISGASRKYTIVGMRTSLSEQGYIDIYDLEFGADPEFAILVGVDD